MGKPGLGETWTRELIEQELARIKQRLDQHLNQGESYDGNMTLDLAWCYSAAITMLGWGVPYTMWMDAPIERTADHQGLKRED